MIPTTKVSDNVILSISFPGPAVSTSLNGVDRMIVMRDYVHSLHIKASAAHLVNLLWMEVKKPMPHLKTFDTVISKYFEASRIDINPANFGLLQVVVPVF